MNQKKENIKNKKKQGKLVNYMLTMGFIFFILMFFMSVVYISRFIFSDRTAVNHITKTQNLLNDINKVGEQIANNKDIQKDDKIDELLQKNIWTLGNNIQDLGFINYKKQNKSIVTIFLDKHLLQSGNIYYIQFDNLSSLDYGKRILYKTDTVNQIGVITSIDLENNKTVIIDIDSQKIITIPTENIIGEILFKYEK